MSSLNWTFDTVAETYEKLRPGYVDELYQAIFEYKPIDNTSNVVEIGIGGGQATLPFLQTGCELTAIDYGDLLPKLIVIVFICKEKCLHNSLHLSTI